MLYVVRIKTLIMRDHWPNNNNKKKNNRIKHNRMGQKMNKFAGAQDLEPPCEGHSKLFGLLTTRN